MRSNSKRYPCKFLQYRSLGSVYMYRVHFSPMDGDRIFLFACPKERTEREKADRKMAEVGKSVKSKWMWSNSKG